ncbi:hypothetical protein [uncultured Paraglaciecola sp.]|uniref:hypothetical protein n=1 Tax=uncultured Paraglaciecola sp. TaxID=1765024 RepID=UPI002615A03D|nr:hypothetical protein [uncultured Paraglaciecola sp.]
MKKITPVLACIMSIGITACNDDNDVQITPDTEFVFDFNTENFSAAAIFSDYPEGEETFYELDSGYENLPSTFSDIKGWRLVGNNHSDDLFMGITLPIDGLFATTLYQATLTVDIVSNISKNCVGIGGAPGESVYVNLAASKDEPINTLDNNMYRLNIDIGNQSQSGTEGVVVGNIANSVECGLDPIYEKKTLTMTDIIDVMSDNEGGLWITAGFDSGFEGKTEVFITKITATIVE